MTVQSTHKTLSALTQASMLHGAADADIEAVDRALDVLQSTKSVVFAPVVFGQCTGADGRSG